MTLEVTSYPAYLLVAFEAVREEQDPGPRVCLSNDRDETLLQKPTDEKLFTRYGGLSYSFPNFGFVSVDDGAIYVAKSKIHREPVAHALFPILCQLDNKGLPITGFQRSLYC